MAFRDDDDRNRQGRYSNSNDVNRDNRDFQGGRRPQGFDARDGDFGQQQAGGDGGYGGGNESGHHDPDYSQWRDEQVRNLDNDYQSWRQDRDKKFSDDFNSWRTTRSGGQGQNQAPGASDTATRNCKRQQRQREQQQCIVVQQQAAQISRLSADVTRGLRPFVLLGPAASYETFRLLPTGCKSSSANHGFIAEEVPMRCPSCCILVAAALLSAQGHAETESEYASHSPAATAATVDPAPVRRLPRAPAYAPDAAKTAARMRVEEREERAFIKSAAALARFEAEAGQLALTKSGDARIKAFAADLIARHQAAAPEFAYLLHVRSMALPMLDNHHRLALKKLGKLGGRKFDSEFMAQVGQKAQQDDIRQYEKIAQATQDPSLRGWIERQLPVLRQQLVAAESFTPHEGRAVQARRGGGGAQAAQQPIAGAPPMAKPVAARLNESSSR